MAWLNQPQLGIELNTIHLLEREPYWNGNLLEPMETRMLKSQFREVDDRIESAPFWTKFFLPFFMSSLVGQMTMANIEPSQTAQVASAATSTSGSANNLCQALVVDENQDSALAATSPGSLGSSGTSGTKALPYPGLEVHTLQPEKRIEGYFARLEPLMTNPNNLPDAIQSRLRHFFDQDFNGRLMDFIGMEFRILIKDQDREANEQLVKSAVQYAETVKDLNSRIAKYNQENPRPGFFSLYAFGLKLGPQRDRAREEILKLEKTADQMMADASELHRQMHLRIENHQLSFAKLTAWIASINDELVFLENFEAAISKELAIQKKQIQDQLQEPQPVLSAEDIWRRDQLAVLLTTTADTFTELTGTLARLKTAQASYKTLNDANTRAEQSFEKNRKLARLQIAEAPGQQKLLTSAESKPEPEPAPKPKQDHMSFKKPRLDSPPSGVKIVGESFFHNYGWQRMETALQIVGVKASKWEVYDIFRSSGENNGRLGFFKGGDDLYINAMQIGIVQRYFLYRGYRVGDKLVGRDHMYQLKAFLLNGEVIVLRGLKNWENQAEWQRVSIDTLDQFLSSKDFTFEPNNEPFVK